jgi:hypothetical protein
VDRAPRARHRAASLAAVLVAVALVAAACSGGSKKSGQRNTSGGDDATSTTAAPAVAPLTGVELFNPEIATRAAVMVKVPDDSHARPQSGLDKADVIYEDRVEGNTVRFLAVFQSKDATTVGPVRSVRSTDAGIIAPIGGVFVFSGGIEPFKTLVRQQGVTVVIEDENGTSFTLRADRQRPYKTYANTATMRALAKTPTAPPALFTFLGKGETFAAQGASAAANATVTWGPGTVSRWDWDAAASTWKRSINGVPHKIEGGAQLAFTNVILQTVPYRPTAYRDRANSGVDEAVTVGSGTAILLTQGGQQVPLHWTKPSLKGLTVFTTADGRTLRLPSGTTWVALVPTGTAINVASPPPPATTAP